MGAHIPKRIKDFRLPSDVLDDGPQFVMSVSAGALFGAWVTARGDGHAIDWVWGWPLIFLVAIALSLAAWLWRSTVTDRAKTRREQREDVTHETVAETRELVAGTREEVAEVKQMVREMLGARTQTASGIAETASAGYSGIGGGPNLTAKSSLQIGGMKLEAKGEVAPKETEVEGDQGA